MAQELNMKKYLIKTFFTIMDTVDMESQYYMEVLKNQLTNFYLKKEIKVNQ